MDKGLENVLGVINKKHGNGSIIDMETVQDNVEWISSGCISLDLALGGGFAKGRIAEVISVNESSGKTTLAIHVMAEAQKAGGTVAMVDAEHAFDIFYARKVGLDTSKDKFLISQPESAEMALDIVDQLVKSGQISVVVVDSVAALTPKAEIDGEMGDSKMGLQARLMSQAMRKLTHSISASNTLVLFINQMREKIGVMFGSPNVTTGGKALKFYATQRVELSRIGQEKVGEEIISNRTRAKIIKNKVAPPFKKAEFDIVFGEGISKEADIMDLSVNLDIVHKSGSWFSYEETKLGQGRGNVIILLKDNPELFEEIELKVKKELNLI